MFNLKLADYGEKKEKFERFLEVGEDFVFGGGEIYLKGRGCQACSLCCESHENAFFVDKFNKDQKDPLNRFDGLFDGRTYGEGRFVLVEDDLKDFGNNSKNSRRRKLDMVGDEPAICSSHCGNCDKKLDMYRRIAIDHKNKEYFCSFDCANQAVHKRACKAKEKRELVKKILED